MAEVVSDTRVSAWGGGGSPYAVSSNKLGMWLFLMSDTLTFTAFLIAYSYLRLSNVEWPRPFGGFNIFMATVMTFCLLSSSLTMVLAVAAAKRQEMRRAVIWIMATITGGLLFMILHINEWLELIHEGVTPFGNPWGVPLFGASFFTLTGLHMTHVTGGVVYLAIVAYGLGKGKYNADDVEVSGLYWHFVDLVWMFIFPMVYLLSNQM
ncbi:MAG: cytochrome c oxidase subunit 3 [Acidobacteriota bacterium]